MIEPTCSHLAAITTVTLAKRQERGLSLLNASIGCRERPLPLPRVQF